MRRIYLLLLFILNCGLLLQGCNTSRTNTNYETSNAIATHPGENIPRYVYDVLDYIHLHGHAPDRFSGGRHFGNFEHHLPDMDASGRKINYREWDVHPRFPGRNRGAERLITGSDGKAWYTEDHYNSFTEVVSGK